MVYITGDTHGNFRRLSMDTFPEQRGMTKNDYVIVCGDFGIWDGSNEENYWFNWLNEKSFTTLFVDGNHSNFDMLKEYPVQKWNGGDAHFIRDSVIHLMRGQVYNIDGKKFFTMGGATSHDIEGGILEVNDPEYMKKRRALNIRGINYRINHLSWWKEEMPSDEEYGIAIKNLEANDYKVDYIISHCCPTFIQDILSSGIYQSDRLTNFFNEVSGKCDFKYWFFGHYHDNRTISQRYILLYEQIIKIPEK